MPDVRLSDVELELYTVTIGWTATFCALPDTPALSVVVVKVYAPRLVGAVALLYVRTNCWPLSQEWSTVTVRPEIVMLFLPVESPEQVALVMVTSPLPPGSFTGAVQDDGKAMLTLELLAKS